MKGPIYLLTALCLLLFHCGETTDPATASDTSDTAPAGTIEPVENDSVSLPAASGDTLGSADAASDPDESPLHTVSLSKYCMSQYEVTLHEFAEMVNWACDSAGDIAVPVFDYPFDKFDTAGWSSDTVTLVLNEPDTISIDKPVRIFRFADIFPSGDTLYYGDSLTPMVLLDTSAYDVEIEYCSTMHHISVSRPDTFVYDTTDVAPRTPLRIAGSRTFTYALPVIKRIELTVAQTHLNLPVTQVSWQGAALFCNIKSDSLGLARAYDDNFNVNPNSSGYRLPTEAEWELAARGGSSHADSYFPTGPTINEYSANYRRHMSVGLAKAVGSFPANGFGLYDMAGNVWEWCTDYYNPVYYDTLAAHQPVTDPVNINGADSARVIRGGSYADDADEQRSANRAWEAPLTLDPHIGFRTVIRK